VWRASRDALARSDTQLAQTHAPQAGRERGRERDGERPDWGPSPHAALPLPTALTHESLPASLVAFRLNRTSPPPDAHAPHHTTRIRTPPQRGPGMGHNDREESKERTAATRVGGGPEGAPQGPAAPDGTRSNLESSSPSPAPPQRRRPCPSACSGAGASPTHGLHVQHARASTCAVGAS
jgi:hypothetical protein